VDTRFTTRSAKSKRAERTRYKADAGPQAKQTAGVQTFWLFELDDDGTVIYSRPHVADTELEGHNFFDECLGFEDIPRYRQHFYSFIKSKKAAASFIWRCSSARGSVDTRVLMTRAFQTGSYPPTGVVMMEIRGC
jgi:hypothetical protein